MPRRWSNCIAQPGERLKKTESNSAMRSLAKSRNTRSRRSNRFKRPTRGRTNETKRNKIHKGIVLCILCLFVANFSLFAAEGDSTGNAPSALTPDLELLSRGKPVFPRIWHAYRPIPLPPIDRENGPKVSRYIKEGKLALSLSEFMQLVV